MKVIFINLHKINFLLVPYAQLRSGWAVKTYKHKFFLDDLLTRGICVLNLIDCDEKDRDKEEAEANDVYAGNGYAEGQIKNLFLNQLDVIEKTDIVIAYFHYFRGYLTAQKIDCKRVLFGNHFFRVKTGQYFRLKEAGYSAFINEIDAHGNPFLQQFFDMNGIQLITFPYVFAPRFQNKVDFQNRLNKAMAIGTLSTVKDIEEYSGYRSFYQTDWVQPMRREILRKKRWLRTYIDSYISYLYEGQMRLNQKDGRLIRWFKTRYNATHVQQQKYTSFDIVEAFNKYRMFICPEELAGVYGISVMEGMACGTAYIGLDHPMYRGIGLIPGVHYISYDGTMGDLKRKIAYYQSHLNELETIAKTGEEFVRSRFAPERVAAELYEALQEISKEGAE